MAAPIAGEQFIRTLRHYLEANEHRLLSSTPQSSYMPPAQPPIIKEEEEQEPNGFLKTVSSLWNDNSSNNASSSSRSSISKPRPNSLYGIPIPYMSLLAIADPAHSMPNKTISSTPFIPLKSGLTLDIHYLYFLLVQFEYLGLEESHLPVPEQHGLVTTETTSDSSSPNGKAASIRSVGSMMSTLSLSTGWQFWSSQNEKQQKKQQQRPLHEDIVYIHRYFSKITTLRLHMNLLMDTQRGVTRSGQRTIRGYEKPLPQDGTVALSLKCFKNLKYLEMQHVSPRCIADWSELQQSLISLVVKSGQIDNAADIIRLNDTPWSELKLLSLADNSLTTLEDDAAQLLRGVSHLNLSSNLLIDIPAALASLYNLSCLNLSHNMISFATGVNTVLGNIQELDLRGNRLTVLAGLDRLWALEKLDVRDNRIEDAAEIGRLTSLPNISMIWVEGNPFTKLQSDYRVDIFTLFKRNNLNIELDGTGPSFAERRRIQVPINKKESDTPIASATIATEVIPSSTLLSSSTSSSSKNKNEWPTAVVDNGPIDEQQQKEEVEEEVEEATSIATTKHNNNNKDTSYKKKIARAKSKNSKRQIRLGQIKEDNIPLPTAAIAAEAEDDSSNNKKHMHRLADLEEAVQQEAANSRRAASIRSRKSNKKGNKKPEEAATTTSQGAESTKRSSELFRKKIEAMRREAGTEWLRVLQEMDVVKKTP
ncbi:MAG: hypothetical protein EXX96DRAFT_322695 [Benjaminiella poitrasii]|nr:MAG: hypothetical protein EXX96DRAFT_322695 [Benjaminiella poitrasii]